MSVQRYQDSVDFGVKPREKASMNFESPSNDFKSTSLPYLDDPWTNETFV
jgi:hypothetical protein